MASAVVSGAFRVSNNNNVFNRAFSGLTSVSAWVVQDLIIANGASDVILSYAQVSVPNVVFMTATSIVRVNFAGHASYVSAASAGWQFKDLFVWMGSGISGPIALHFANSSGDSATVTVGVGM